MKKKIIAITLVLSLAAIAISGASLAYFTDKQTVDNTFEVGDVTITLDESKVTLDAKNHAVVGTERVSTTQDYGQLYPGQTVKKDPIITNKGSENAYVAAKVTISSTNGYTVDNQQWVADLLSGGLLAAGANATVVTALESNAHVIYILYHEEMAKDDQVNLFDTLSIPGTYDNDQMDQLTGMKIQVAAYAVQSIGFADAKTALTTAFPELAALN